MTSLLVAWSLLSVGADPGRPYLEIKADFRAALRRESEAATFAERAAAVADLCKIHREIVGDSRFLESVNLQEYRKQIAVRLFSVQNDLQRQLRREKAKAAGVAAQPAARLPTTSTTQANEQSQIIAEQLALAASFQGGPLQLAGAAGSSQNRGGDMIPDNGQGLVELIQRTIRPEHWDVNGGPASIVYFAPLRCLVVRATAEVHQDLGGLVGGLRAAGP